MHTGAGDRAGGEWQGWVDLSREGRGQRSQPKGPGTRVSPGQLCARRVPRPSQQVQAAAVAGPHTQGPVRTQHLARGGSSSQAGSATRSAREQRGAGTVVGGNGVERGALGRCAEAWERG